MEKLSCQLAPCHNGEVVRGIGAPHTLGTTPPSGLSDWFDLSGYFRNGAITSTQVKRRDAISYINVLLLLSNQPAPMNV